MKHVKHCEAVHKSSTIQLSGNRRYLLTSDVLWEKILAIRFGFLHVLTVIFQTNSCGKWWLKPGFTEFQTGLGGGRGGAGAVVAFPVVLFFPGSVGYPGGSFHLHMTSAKISESKYVDICNFSPDLIKICQ